MTRFEPAGFGWKIECTVVRIKLGQGTYIDGKKMHQRTEVGREKLKVGGVKRKGNYMYFCCKCQELKQCLQWD
jgi:hypothetical protein